LSAGQTADISIRNVNWSGINQTDTPPYDLSKSGTDIGNYGRSCSISANGNTALIAGHFDNDSGGAFIWTKNESTGVWTQTDNLSKTGAGGYYGVACSISADGKTVLITGHSSTINAGCAYIWAKHPTSGVWSETGNLSKTNAGGSYGQSCSLSADGDTALIAGHSSRTAGGAWIWTRDYSTGSWAETGNLSKSGAGGRYGKACSISANGRTAIVSGESGDGATTGGAWIWEKDVNTGLWSQTYNLSGSGGYYGLTSFISADGKTVFIGSNSSSYGRIMTKDDTTGAWSQTGNLSKSGVSGQYGVCSLSADGGVALIGSPPSGGAWIWTKNIDTGVWSQTGNLTKTSTNYGQSCSISADGKTALVGGYTSTSEGSVWVWSGVDLGERSIMSSIGSGYDSLVPVVPDGGYKVVIVAKDVNDNVGVDILENVFEHLISDYTPKDLSNTSFVYDNMVTETLTILNRTNNICLIFENTVIDDGDFIDFNITQIPLSNLSYLSIFNFGLVVNGTYSVTSVNPIGGTSIGIQHHTHNHNGWQGYWNGLYSGGSLSTYLTNNNPKTYYCRVTRTNTNIKFDIFNDEERTIYRSWTASMNLTATKTNTFTEPAQLYIGIQRILGGNGQDNETGYSYEITNMKMNGNVGINPSAPLPTLSTLRTTITTTTTTPDGITFTGSVVADEANVTTYYALATTTQLTNEQVRTFILANPTNTAYTTATVVAGVTVDLTDVLMLNVLDTSSGNSGTYTVEPSTTVNVAFVYLYATDGETGHDDIDTTEITPEGPPLVKNIDWKNWSLGVNGGVITNEDSVPINHKDTTKSSSSFDFFAVSPDIQFYCYTYDRSDNDVGIHFLKYDSISNKYIELNNLVVTGGLTSNRANVKMGLEHALLYMKNKNYALVYKYNSGANAFVLFKQIDLPLTPPNNHHCKITDDGMFVYLYDKYYNGYVYKFDGTSYLLIQTVKDIAGGPGYGALSTSMSSTTGEFLYFTDVDQGGTNGKITFYKYNPTTVQYDELNTLNLTTAWEGQYASISADGHYVATSCYIGNQQIFKYNVSTNTFVLMATQAKHASGAAGNYGRGVALSGEGKYMAVFDNLNMYIYQKTSDETSYTFLKMISTNLNNAYETLLTFEGEGDYFTPDGQYIKMFGFENTNNNKTLLIKGFDLDPPYIKHIAPYPIITEVANIAENDLTLVSGSVFSSITSITKYYVVAFVTSAPSGSVVDTSTIDETTIASFITSLGSLTGTGYKTLLGATGTNMYYNENGVAQYEVENIANVTVASAFTTLAPTATDGSEMVDITTTSGFSFDMYTIALDSIGNYGFGQQIDNTVYYYATSTTPLYLSGSSDTNIIITEIRLYADTSFTNIIPITIETNPIPGMTYITPEYAYNNDVVLEDDTNIFSINGLSNVKDTYLFKIKPINKNAVVRSSKIFYFRPLYAPAINLTYNGNDFIHEKLANSQTPVANPPTTEETVAQQTIIF
jgi:hypothetical protein